MRKNELKEGEEYAIRLGRGRWNYTKRAVYYGEAPWTTGTGEAILTTIPCEGADLSQDDEGVWWWKREGFVSIRIRESKRTIGFAGKGYFVQPDTSGWRTSAFDRPGKGKRGLFVMSDVHGNASFILVAYGDKIQRTWAEHELREVIARQATEQAEAERAVLAQYRLAIVREALEVLDSLGVGEDLILGHDYTREEVAGFLDADAPRPLLLRQSPNAALILLGAGKHDPFDLLLTHTREEA